MHGTIIGNRTGYLLLIAVLLTACGGDDNFKWPTATTEALAISSRSSEIRFFQSRAELRVLSDSAAGLSLSGRLIRTNANRNRSTRVILPIALFRTVPEYIEQPVVVVAADTLKAEIALLQTRDEDSWIVTVRFDLMVVDTLTHSGNDSVPDPQQEYPFKLDVRFVKSDISNQLSVAVPAGAGREVVDISVHLPQGSHLLKRNIGFLSRHHQELIPLVQLPTPFATADVQAIITSPAPPEGAWDFSPIRYRLSDEIKRSRRWRVLWLLLAVFYGTSTYLLLRSRSYPILRVTRVRTVRHDVVPSNDQSSKSRNELVTEAQSAVRRYYLHRFEFSRANILKDSATDFPRQLVAEEEQHLRERYEKDIVAATQIQSRADLRAFLTTYDKVTLGSRLMVGAAAILALFSALAIFTLLFVPQLWSASTALTQLRSPPPISPLIGELAISATPVESAPRDAKLLLDFVVLSDRNSHLDSAAVQIEAKGSALTIHDVKIIEPAGMTLPPRGPTNVTLSIPVPRSADLSEQRMVVMAPAGTFPLYHPQADYYSWLNGGRIVRMEMTVRNAMTRRDRTPLRWVHLFPFDGAKLKVSLSIREGALLDWFELSTLQGYVTTGTVTPLNLRFRADQGVLRAGGDKVGDRIPIPAARPIQIAATYRRGWPERLLLLGLPVAAAILGGLLLGYVAGLPSGHRAGTLITGLGVIGLPLWLRGAVLGAYPEIPHILRGGPSIFEIVFLLSWLLFMVISIRTSRSRPPNR
jgi:hypothetical protein